MKSREEFLSMRFRDLKRHLLLLGVNEMEISKRLDKHELVDLAMIYQDYKSYQDKTTGDILSLSNEDQFYQVIQWIGLVICAGLLLYIIRNFQAISFSIKQWFARYFYNIRQKFPALRYAYRKFLLISMLYLIISILLDLYIAHIQISIVVRWFTSSNSIYLAKTLSFPLKAPMMNSGEQSFGLDIGPMITTWLCQKVKQWCEVNAADIILTHRQKAE